jgi:hypothetical protein
LIRIIHIIIIRNIVVAILVTVAAGVARRPVDAVQARPALDVSLAEQYRLRSRSSSRRRLSQLRGGVAAGRRIARRVAIGWRRRVGEERARARRRLRRRLHVSTIAVG